MSHAVDLPNRAVGTSHYHRIHGKPTEDLPWGALMSRGDLLKKMFQSYEKGDDTAFRAAAKEVIDEERKKKHDILADQLAGLLQGKIPRPRPLHVASLKPLPKGREDMPLLSLENPFRSFADLVLKERTRTALLELVREFRSGSVLRAHALRPRTRLLFIGPPGCGKSVTAEATALELGIPLAKVHLATVVSSYLGETSRNLEAIFSFCEQGSWVILFDEFDALAKERSDKAEHGELKRVVTAFLQLLDDFQGDSLVIAATNHPTLLDEAVWRRFDEVIDFPLPTQPEIKELLKVKLRGARHRFSILELARRMKGLSHAEVELICHYALRRTVLASRDEVHSEDIDDGLRRMEERRTAIRSYLD